MAQDYFAVLGLTPGRYAPQEIAALFAARRAQLLAELDEPTRRAAARAALDELHRAQRMLRDPARQAEYRAATAGGLAPVRALQLEIAAALEDGLLRHSQRQRIVARALELGLSEFQAHLLIAQVQFGEELGAAVATGGRAAGADRRPLGARVAGVTVLAAAMFGWLVYWLR